MREIGNKGICEKKHSFLFIEEELLRAKPAPDARIVIPGRKRINY
jgi:hypothetical protein